MLPDSDAMDLRGVHHLTLTSQLGNCTKTQDKVEIF